MCLNVLILDSLLPSFWFFRAADRGICSNGFSSSTIVLATFENPDSTSNSLAISSGRGADFKSCKTRNFILDISWYLTTVSKVFMRVWCNILIKFLIKLPPLFPFLSWTSLLQLFSFLVAASADIISGWRFNEPPLLLQPKKVPIQLQKVINWYLFSINCKVKNVIWFLPWSFCIIKLF